MYEESSILIVSQPGETAENLSRTAAEYGFNRISATDGGNARELIAENGYSLVFVSAPLEKEFGLDLAAYAAKYGSGVIIAAAAKLCGEMAEKVGDADIFILPRPLNKAMLLQTFRYVLLSRARTLSLNGENLKLENKIKDVKLIDRAKCVLVEYLRISEADAHRQIQKRAMDMRVPQVEIALDILKTYET